MLNYQIGNKINMAAPLVGYASGARYVFRAKFLFDGIPLNHAKVLEIGCGNGAWVIWSALNGADEAIGIEPEDAGSISHSLVALRETVKALGLSDKVQSFNYFLNQLPMEEEKFNVVMMFDVINHMDEKAVVDLHKNSESFNRFLTVAQGIYRRLKPGGWLIVADCGRKNFWNQLGLISPFARNIEWSKHQDPPTWKEVFTKAGFQFHDLRWSPLQPFPRITGNWFVQYLTFSHFVLRFKK